MRELAPMTLAELDGAPFRIALRATLPATPAAVFDELGDPSLWFPLMRRSVWRTGATSGVGAQREVDVLGFGRFRETMLAWDSPASAKRERDGLARVAFTMTATTSPLVARMAEDWRITSRADGSELEWIVAAHPSAIGRPLTPVLRFVIARMFGMARTGLAKRTAWSAHRVQGAHTS